MISMSTVTKMISYVDCYQDVDFYVDCYQDDDF